MKRILLYSLLISLFIFSCSDSTTIFEEESTNFDNEIDASVLTNSIVYDKSGVMEIYEDAREGAIQGRFVNEQAGDYPLSLVAQVSPPSFRGGENLTATDVHLDGDFAYISYNTPGADYKGAVDVVNISDPASPRLTGRAYSYDKDLNAIHYDNGYGYIVGGMDAEKSALATANSVIIKVAINNGRFNTSDLAYNYQEGFNANDALVSGNSLFVTSGKDGYVTEFDKNSLEIINEAPFEDLRSVVIKDGKYLVLDASIGVRILNAQLEETSQIQIDSDFRVADKRTLDLMGDKVVVSEGENGAGIYDIATGTFQEYIPITVNPANVAESDIVTNATAFNEGAILMANGGGGLCLSEDNNGTLSTVGVIELDGSINYVASRGDYIFAASGREGLQIIKMNKPSEDLAAKCSGTPTYSGSNTLNVTASQTLAYSGSKRFRTIDVAGELLLCGTWTVNLEVDVFDNALFEMRGTFIVARNNRRRNLTVGENATLRIEGNLTVYGDLILEDNATIEFVGENSRVNIFGDVDSAASANVLGSFDDIQDKF
ncbi:hypothetical protein [Croceitalea rosinachiae]|uniref:LVIVD repeat-containing protein n=1 Tax=Croceitalea rosinachiae TaxID=3075596 RepID=A0ABU3ACM8_9FLAO|nr:hypothetical protein [Croceitalea sp. F388]MDT0607668.1 hypothetical protein [Croceitalea sp. F388]